VINVRNDIILKAFGSKLRELRNAAGLSQQGLANISGIEVSQVGRIERGETNYSFSTMQVLAVSLNVPLSQILISIGL
jgi:transcriptional regulator with XRE-family HTH domain